MQEEKIVTRNETLPSTIEELIDFVIVGNEAVKAWKNKIRAIDKAEIASGAHKQILKDGQKMGELVLLAEAKLGELLSKNPPGFHQENSGKIFQNPLPSGINKKESHYAQEIFRYPDVLHKIITETVQRNDIPTRHDILKAIKETKREAKKQAQKEEIMKGVEQPTGLYDVIVIDPPWHFDGKYDADGRRTTATYPQMTYEQIQNIELPVKDDCILWLWTTHKDLWEAKNILEHWGFNYKGMIIWNKVKMGIGTWIRFQCEFCLLGIKGKPLWEHHDIRDIIQEERRSHSEKPDIFYEMIDTKFVGRKLDYFGRTKRDGWDIYGAGQNSV